MFDKPALADPLSAPASASVGEAGGHALLPPVHRWALQKRIPAGFEDVVRNRIRAAVILHLKSRHMWEMKAGERDTIMVSPISPVLEGEMSAEFRNQTIRIARTAAICNAWGEAALIAIAAGKIGDFRLRGHFSAELAGIAMGLGRVLKAHPERREAEKDMDRSGRDSPALEAIEAGIDSALEQITDEDRECLLRNIIEDLKQGSDKERLEAAAFALRRVPLSEERMMSQLQSRILFDFNQAPDVERLEALADFFTKQIMTHARAVPEDLSEQKEVFSHLLESVSRYMGSEHAGIWFKGLRDDLAGEIPDDPEKRPYYTGETATVEAMDKALEEFVQLEKTQGLDDFDSFLMPVLGDGPYECDNRTAYSVERAKVSPKTPELAEARVLEAEGRHEEAVAKLREIAVPWEDVRRTEGQSKVAQAYEFMLNHDFESAIATAAEIEDPDYRADVLSQIAFSGARPLGADRAALLFQEAAETAANTESLEITALAQTALFESLSAEEARMDIGELRKRSLNICRRIGERIREEALGGIFRRPEEVNEYYSYQLLRIAELQFRLGEPEKASDTLKLAEELPLKCSWRYDISGQTFLTLVRVGAYAEAISLLEERYFETLFDPSFMPLIFPRDIDELLPYLDSVSEAISLVTQEAATIVGHAPPADYRGGMAVFEHFQKRRSYLDPV